MAGKRVLVWSLVFFLCLPLLGGCNGERDKGINRGLDKPAQAKQQKAG